MYTSVASSCRSRLGKRLRLRQSADLEVLTSSAIVHFAPGVVMPIRAIHEA